MRIEVGELRVGQAGHDLRPASCRFGASSPDGGTCPLCGLEPAIAKTAIELALAHRNVSAEDRTGSSNPISRTRVRSW